MKPKLKVYKIFKCPYCNKKPFTALRGLNEHLTKSHSDFKLSIMLDARHRARPRTK